MATATTNHPSSQPPSSSSVFTVKNSLIFSVSLASSVLALYFFSQTNFYNIHFGQFGNPFLSILFSSITILFLSNSSFKNTNNNHTPLRSFVKYVATGAVMLTSLFLYNIPEKSPTGLFFVIFLWVHIITILHIVGYPSTELKLPVMLLMVIVSRGMELYNFSGTYWLIMIFCVFVLYARGHLM